MDYALLVENEHKLLCEVKSPSFMKKVGKLLPVRGIELEWTRGQSLVQRILSQVCPLFPPSVTLLL